MPSACTVCSKNFYSYQNKIQCTFCHGWCHHGNRLECSNLSEVEFKSHVEDVFKPYECDTCVNKRISQANLVVFQRLPFLNDYDDALRYNIFLEDAIRKHPDQYLWQHRRFKTRHEGERTMETYIYIYICYVYIVFI